MRKGFFMPRAGAAQDRGAAERAQGWCRDARTTRATTAPRSTSFRDGPTGLSGRERVLQHEAADPLARSPGEHDHALSRDPEPGLGPVRARREVGDAVSVDVLGAD